MRLPFERRVYQPNPPQLAISKQLLQRAENDAICMRVWLPPTLSSEHNLFFMLFVYTYYQVERCVCVCICTHSACCWVHVDRSNSLFGRAVHINAHLEKSLRNTCALNITGGCRKQRLYMQYLMWSCLWMWLPCFGAWWVPVLNYHC